MAAKTCEDLEATSSPRATLLAEILALYCPSPLIGCKGHIIAPRGAIRSATVSAVYSIPRRLIDQLSEKLPGRLTEDELTLEKRFTELCCSQKQIGLFLGKFFGHPYLDPQAPFKPGPRNFSSAELPGDLSMDRVNRLAGNLSVSVAGRQQAYLGWLFSNQTYLSERNHLRTRWEMVIGKTEDSIPNLGTKRLPSYRWELNGTQTEAPPCEMFTEFDAFYTRWQLTCMKTWDLPVPVTPNFGVPEAESLQGLGHGPSIRLPGILRMPVDTPYAELLQAPLPEHLAEWERIQDANIDGLDYRRLQCAFRLLHYLDTVLLRAYPNRFGNAVGKLDEVFAKFFGHIEQDSIARIRQWFRRRSQLTDGTTEE